MENARRFPVEHIHCVPIFHGLFWDWKKKGRVGWNAALNVMEPLSRQTPLARIIAAIADGKEEYARYYGAVKKQGETSGVRAGAE